MKNSMKKIEITVDPSPRSTAISSYTTAMWPAIGDLLTDDHLSWEGWRHTEIAISLSFNHARYKAAGDLAVYVQTTLNDLLRAGGSLESCGWRCKDGVFQPMIGLGRLEEPYTSDRHVFMFTLPEVRWDQVLTYTHKISPHVEAACPEDYAALTAWATDYWAQQCTAENEGESADV